LGSPNEVTIKVNRITVSALLDTGSTVSTVSESFYLQYLANQPIQTLNHILHIECADGEEMPYLGYITVDLELPGTSTSNRPQHCLLLVVPDSTYNRNVPLLIGTNVLKVAMNDVKQRFGVRILQEAELFTPWYLTFRCLLLREKELYKRSYKLAVIKCVEKKSIRIPPNRDVTIQGYTDQELPYQPICCIMQPTDKAAIPDDLDIAPSLVSYQYRNDQLVPVHISNVTTRTITVSPNAILCELQPVSVADIDLPEDTSSDILHNAHYQLKSVTNNWNKEKDYFNSSETCSAHQTRI
jgi:hypothetical protein